jgi:hypothetical protein
VRWLGTVSREESPIRRVPIWGWLCPPIHFHAFEADHGGPKKPNLGRCLLNWWWNNMKYHETSWNINVYSFILSTKKNWGVLQLQSDVHIDLSNCRRNFLTAFSWSAFPRHRMITLSHDLKTSRRINSRACFWHTANETPCSSLFFFAYLSSLQSKQCHGMPFRFLWVSGLSLSRSTRTMRRVGRSHYRNFSTKMSYRNSQHRRPCRPDIERGVRDLSQSSATVQTLMRFQLCKPTKMRGKRCKSNEAAHKSSKLPLFFPQ